MQQDAQQPSRSKPNIWHVSPGLVVVALTAALALAKQCPEVQPRPVSAPAQCASNS